MSLEQSRSKSASSATYLNSLSHAFDGDPARKNVYLSRIRAYREAGHLIRGTGSDVKAGCAIGCTVGAYDHQRYQQELGVPLALVYLKELMFERLPLERAMEWPERFLSAIEPGADLSGVPNRFVHWLLGDPSHGVIRYTSCEMADLAASVASCHEVVANGGTPPIGQLRATGAMGALRRQSLGSPLLERVMDVIEWAAYGLDREEPRFAVEAARVAVCVGIWGKAQALGRGRQGCDSESWIELLNTLYQQQSDKIIELLHRAEAVSNQ